MKRHNVDVSEYKDRIRYWITMEMRTGNTFDWQREILMDLTDIPHTPYFAPYVRHWFAGAGPICPVTEPFPAKRGLSTTVIRLMIAAAIRGDKFDHATAQVLVDRACDLCAEFLYEPTQPFDVYELNFVLSNDDDEQIVAMDASMRLEDKIRRNSPLHPLRLVLTWMQSVNYDVAAILEMLYDDENGKLGAFPLFDRLYDWARERRAALRAAARAWHTRHWTSGGWHNASVPADDEDEEEEEVPFLRRAHPAMEEEEEEDEPFEFDIQFDDVEMGVEPGAEPEPANGEDEPEPANGDEEEPEDDDDYEATRPIFIEITQMAGDLEVQKVFLLPADEEPRRLALPTRIDQPGEEDVWPRILYMTKKLMRRMETVSKNPQSAIRRHCRELAENIKLFLDSEKQYTD